MSKIKRFTPLRIAVFLFLAVWTLVFFGGFAWIILNSLKDRLQYVLDKTGLPDVWRFRNYIDAFTVLSAGGKGVPLMIWNSLWRVVGSIAISTACSFTVGYCLARYKFPGRDLLYWICIVTMMIPIYGSMAASLRLRAALGMYDTPLILLGALGIGGMLIPYSCFKNLPREYAESAFMDGASHFRVYFTIMLPQMIPIMTALGVTSFIGGWNDYMTSIVYMPSYPTLATGLYLYQVESARKMNYPILFAGIIMSIVPALALFIAFQNTFLEINIGGGLKG
ncbi:MAG: carbohydrate ABC transporter permease [Clostridiales bacterium]|jgi:ABC-type glycerol-3-phosphate transport system permease component|nr:carbohydrate ABC transporter permease [Clostridiales bacterium]